MGVGVGVCGGLMSWLRVEGGVTRAGLGWLDPAGVAGGGLGFSGLLLHYALGMVGGMSWLNWAWDSRAKEFGCRGPGQPGWIWEGLIVYLRY
ncbi:hypothetical protein F5144DRAFT_561495 [Chaetomium tenue]|uniref:Uncharacterized protein n=1 Tax=Chaetomium tenue TaxID=1854479 RepID=A0ACB7PGM8_9PEZI|nr:hypothetical protein F5144DRAFT_561495 [Chaetomium globosum]